MADLRLLAVHAHPDDESSKGAATMAYYVDRGVDVVVATCTGGERGSVLNRALDKPEVWAHLPEIRHKEMDHARQILGVRQEWLGFVDSGLPEGDPLPPLPEGCFALTPVDVAERPLVRLIRSLRPQVVITYDESGGYPHPDHIMTHTVSMAALRDAADPAKYPDEGDPYKVSKVYYHMGMTPRRWKALHEAMIARHLESPFSDWLDNFAGRPDNFDRVTTRINCADFFEVRDAALRAHATQVDPEGHWFACPIEIEKQVWPTEDYQLVSSTVATTLPETDLFAGIADLSGPR